MAKKKPLKSKQKPVKNTQELPESVQKFVQNGLPGFADQLQEGDDSPLDQAQSIMHQAFKEQNERRSAALAHKALAICPDCADAYILLAELTSNYRQALELYQRGVDAGERAIGPQLFKDAAGRFWSVPKTRPYMRARFGLADLLWYAVRHNEAVLHLQDMLRLDPLDNQGVRHTLASYLLCLNRYDELDDLLNRYPDNSAMFAYTKLLLTFRKVGDTPELLPLLKIAKHLNKHVPDVLLSEIPPIAENLYTPGEESEAGNYAHLYLRCWKNSIGALTWLRKAEQSQKEAHKKPDGVIKNTLPSRTAQSTAVWQADFRQLPDWILIAGEKKRPWTIIMKDAANDLIVGHANAEETPSPKLLWDALLQAMKKPESGKPCRPSRLQVTADDRWMTLQPHLEKIGVKLERIEDTEGLDETFNWLHKQILGEPQSAMFDMPGVTVDRVAAFFEAAAAFYLQLPWNNVRDDASIQVVCDAFESGPWYAVVMGQRGLTLGLTLYENLKLLRQAHAGIVDDEKHAHLVAALSVTFVEQADILVREANAIEEHGWKVAGPEAYPSCFKKEQGMMLRPPLAWELELLTASLWAIPAFVKQHPSDDLKPTEMVLPGDLKLVLSWIPTEL